jgi:hypothetical protein
MRPYTFNRDLDMMSRIRRKVMRKPIQKDPKILPIPEEYVNWLTSFEEED